MAKDQITAVKDAIHIVQLHLLEGIQDENQLFAAGSLMSRSDYKDVVIERSIANLCGYPVCHNSLPPERPHKGRYRISLKEHKVYDLQETYMYCSPSCVISSRAFAGSLPEERCWGLNPQKLNEILRLFGRLRLDSDENLGTNEDLARSKLKIQEKAVTGDGEVLIEEWIGPSNAIEGYVPQRDRNSQPVVSKPQKKGSEIGASELEEDKGNSTVRNEMDFKSAIIINEDYADFKKDVGEDKSSIALRPKSPQQLSDNMDFKSTIIINDEHARSKKPPTARKSSKPLHVKEVTEGSKSGKSHSKKEKDTFFNDFDFVSTIITQQDEYSISKAPSRAKATPSDEISREFNEKLNLNDRKQEVDSSYKSSDMGPVGSASYSTESTESSIKSSLKSSGPGKSSRSVTWADKKMSGGASGSLCEVKASDNTSEVSKKSETTETQTDADDDLDRCASAEVCAMALSQAAEAVASGQSDAAEAVSEAGIIWLPQENGADEGDSHAEVVETETGPAPVKWPSKLESSDMDFVDSDDSWFDAPPEDFSLTLSPFATMWNALFSWISSSFLAFIYGRDESSHVNYLSVNGREYPMKMVLSDGCSSEIKQTLASCLARALPGVITDLRLPTPISTLEQGLGRLIDTMSFMDALPPFRMKQWQVILLLLLDALSVHKIPGLLPHMTSKRVLIPKVLGGAQISIEEYEIMRELVLPLGRDPQFSMQS